jgi:hypothetical protein
VKLDDAGDVEVAKCGGLPKCFGNAEG